MVEKVKVESALKGNKKKIEQLFGVQRPAITKHLKNIFEIRELDEKVVSSILERTTQHGAIEGKLQTRPVKFYNLGAIISVVSGDFSPGNPIFGSEPDILTNAEHVST